MSGSNEIVSQGSAGSAGKPIALRRSGNNDDMPMALLEFHSPSAAMAAMPPTATALYTTWIISSLALASLLVMALFPIDRVVTANGALVSTVPMIVVQPLETSIIRSIDVHEGEEVHKGQVLAHLDPRVTNADVSSLGLQSRSLQAEVNRLTAEVTGKDYVADMSDPASTQQAAIFLRRQADYTAKVQDYDQQIAGLRSDVVGFEASAALYAGRVKVATDVHNMRTQLQHDQVGSRLDSLSSQDELMEIERSQITAQQSATSARNKLSAMVAERESYIQNSKAEAYQSLTDAQRKLYEATGAYEKASLQKSLLVMRADRDAVVLNIAHVSVGSVITSAQEFMTLTPLDAPLQIEARLPSAQAGYVQLGDKAQVKFLTFNYIQYGGAQGVVTNISSATFSTADYQAAAASAPANGLATPGGGDTFYRVRLRIDHYTLHGVPSYFKPTAGMVVASDINIGKRTILQYMLSTVIPTATEGMRDPS